MNNNTIELVRRFMVAMGQPINQELSPDLLLLRMRLLDEEAGEVRYEFLTILNALKEGRGVTVEDVARLLKELCDLQYVLDGFFLTFGLNKNAAFAEVHRSNMSKLGDDGKPIYREDGKVMKGPNYRPANVAQFV